MRKKYEGRGDLPGYKQNLKLRLPPYIINLARLMMFTDYLQFWQDVVCCGNDELGLLKMHSRHLQF